MPGSACCRPSAVWQHDDPNPGITRTACRGPLTRGAAAVLVLPAAATMPADAAALPGACGDTAPAWKISRAAPTASTMVLTAASGANGIQAISGRGRAPAG